MVAIVLAVLGSLLVLWEEHHNDYSHQLEVLKAFPCLPLTQQKIKEPAIGSLLSWWKIVSTMTFPTHESMLLYFTKGNFLLQQALQHLSEENFKKSKSKHSTPEHMHY